MSFSHSNLNHTNIPFAPTTSTYKSMVQKGKEFEEYFKRGVEIANITARVEFQKKLTPTFEDGRKFCKPDVVFIKGTKGAVVEIKNYEKTSLPKNQVRVRGYKDIQRLQHGKCAK